jgi:hypothetical protein
VEKLKKKYPKAIPPAVLPKITIPEKSCLSDVRQRFDRLISSGELVMRFHQPENEKVFSCPLIPLSLVPVRFKEPLKI